MEGVSQENPKFYSQAQQVQHLTDSIYTSREAQPMRSQALVSWRSRSAGSVSSNSSSSSALESCRSSSSSSSVSNLENEAFLRETQARSEALDRVVEFCQLERTNAESKKVIMGMQRLIYNVPKKRAIELALPWHSSTVQIAQRNQDVISGRLSKSMKSLNSNKPWGSKDFFTGSGYYTHNAEGYVPRPEWLVIPSRPPPAE